MELITVLVILSIMAAIVIPSLTGFIDKTKEQQYVIEAREVRRSVELYLLDHYGEETDSMELLLDLTACDLRSPDHPLAGYLTTSCSKGASIENLSIDASALRVIDFTYLVGGYRIVIEEGTVEVTKVTRVGKFGTSPVLIKIHRTGINSAAAIMFCMKILYYKTAVKSV